VRTGVGAHAGLAALVITAAFVLTGCQYLFGLGAIPPGGSFDPGIEPFPNGSEPVPTATYTKGTTIVTIGDAAPVTLDRLVGTGSVTDEYGAQASWTDGTGWYVQLYGASENGSIFGEEAFLTLDRIADGRHWTISDPSACKMTVERAGKTGLAGTATCTDVRWVDLMAPYDETGQPAYVEGEAAFDVEVTFEATP
jgi:hypothetical protein